MKSCWLKFLDKKNIAIFAVVLFAALSSFAAKPVLVSELSDFNSYNGELTMRYVEAVSPLAFQYLVKQISPDDQSPQKIEQIRKYHVGIQRASNTLIVYRKKSQVLVIATPVTNQTIAKLEDSLNLFKKSGRVVSDDEDGISTTPDSKLTDLISKDLSAYVDSQSSIPEYLPADSRKRSFGLEHKVDGGSVSFEASQTTYMKSTEAFSSLRQKASLIFKQSVNPHTDAKFEVTHTSGALGEDTAAMATISIHGD